MKSTKLIAGLLLCAATQLFAGATETLDSYRQLGAGPFNPDSGRQLWVSVNTPEQGGNERSCADCHGTDLSLPGKHIRTGKQIEPMSPAVTPARLTDNRKVEKWFKRNCKWTLGRECTPQEKGDLILFIQKQNG